MKLNPALKIVILFTILLVILLLFYLSICERNYIIINVLKQDYKKYFSYFLNVPLINTTHYYTFMLE